MVVESMKDVQWAMVSALQQTVKVSLLGQMPQLLTIKAIEATKCSPDATPLAGH